MSDDYNNHVQRLKDAHPDAGITHRLIQSMTAAVQLAVAEAMASNPGWIRVEDGFPSLGQDYLIAVTDNWHHPVCLGSFDGTMWRDNHGRSRHVSHFRPLPTPPTR